MNQKPKGDILTIRQVARWIQVSERKIYEMTRERNRARQRVPIPVIKIGRCSRFSAEAIDRWLKDLQEIAA
jgi:excisionase family DNA binding protein